MKLKKSSPLFHSHSIFNASELLKLEKGLIGLSYVLNLGAIESYWITIEELYHNHIELKLQKYLQQL